MHQQDSLRHLAPEPCKLRLFPIDRFCRIEQRLPSIGTPVSLTFVQPKSHRIPRRRQTVCSGWRALPFGAGAGIAVLLAGCVHYEARPLQLEQTARSLESRSLELPALRTFLEASGGRPLGAWPLRDWSVEELSVAAVFLNPDLATLRAQRDLAEAGRQTAAGRPNPTVGLQGGYNFDAAHTGITPWMPGTTLDLPIETVGKRSRRIERAAHQARAARLNLAAAAWTLRGVVRVSIVETAAAERKVTLLADELDCLDRIRQILEQRLQAGATTTVEVNTARVNHLRLSAEVADARRAAIEARHRLAQAIGVPASTLARIRLVTPPFLPSLASTQRTALRAAALRERADIQSALATYEASESQLRLEIAKQYPDLHLGNGYQWDQGDNKWTFGLSLELPVLNRNQGPIAEAMAHRAEAAAQAVAIQARVLGNLDQAAMLADLLRTQQRDAQVLARELTLQSQRMAARAERGGADRLEVETARLEELTQRLAAADLDLKLALAETAWESAIQQPLDAASFPPAVPVPASVPVPARSP